MGGLRTGLGHFRDGDGADGGGHLDGGGGELGLGVVGALLDVVLALDHRLGLGGSDGAGGPLVRGEGDRLGLLLAPGPVPVIGVLVVAVVNVDAVVGRVPDGDGLLGTRGRSLLGEMRSGRRGDAGREADGTGVDLEGGITTGRGDIRGDITGGDIADDGGGVLLGVSDGSEAEDEERKLHRDKLG